MRLYFQYHHYAENGDSSDFGYVLDSLPFWLIGSGGLLLCLTMLFIPKSIRSS
jgi:hypothetical protein